METTSKNKEDKFVCHGCKKQFSTKNENDCPFCGFYFCKKCICIFSCCDYGVCAPCSPEIKDYVDYSKCKDCPDRKKRIYSLHEAVKKQRLCAVEFMIDVFEVNESDDKGMKPLDIAIKVENDEIIELLRSHGATETPPEPTISIHEAAANGDIEQIKRNIYHDWLRKSEWDYLSFDDGIRYTPLHLAVEHGHLDAAKLLLEERADPNARRKHSKSYYNHNWDFEKSPSMPLHLAARNGSEQMVELLLSYKSEVNVQDGSGYAPLHLAARYGYHLVAKILIANDADVDEEDFDGQTPLHMAAGRGRKRMVNLLLASGADVNAQDLEGVTPLHLAALGNHKEIVKKLLSHRARIDLKDKYDVTPLDVAKFKKYSDIEILLTPYGAAREDKKQKTH